VPTDSKPNRPATAGFCAISSGGLRGSCHKFVRLLGRRAGGKEQRRDEQAKSAREPEGIAIAAEIGADRSGRQGCQRGSELMRRADPSVDDADIFFAKGVRGEPHRRRDRGDPVQSIKNGEEREPVRRMGERIRQEQ
jgi:type IV secretory pathway TrbL component